jgi:hypothetical protein
MEGGRALISGVGCIQSLVGGLLIMGVGQFFHAIRDMAINSWSAAHAV